MSRAPPPDRHLDSSRMEIWPAGTRLPDRLQLTDGDESFAPIPWGSVAFPTDWPRESRHPTMEQRYARPIEMPQQEDRYRTSTTS